MSEYFRKPIVKTLMLKGEKGETGDSDYKPAVDALGKRIDNLILSSGTESSAEVVDARTGYDGTAHDTLGTAIRSQVSELKSDLVDTNLAVNESVFGENIVRRKVLSNVSGSVSSIELNLLAGHIYTLTVNSRNELYNFTVTNTADPSENYYIVNEDGFKNGELIFLCKSTCITVNIYVVTLDQKEFDLDFEISEKVNASIEDIKNTVSDKAEALEELCAITSSDKVIYSNRIKIDTGKFFENIKFKKDTTYRFKMSYDERVKLNNYIFELRNINNNFDKFSVDLSDMTEHTITKEIHFTEDSVGLWLYCTDVGIFLDVEISEISKYSDGNTLLRKNTFSVPANENVIANLTLVNGLAPFPIKDVNYTLQITLEKGLSIDNGYIDIYWDNYYNGENKQSIHITDTTSLLSSNEFEFKASHAVADIKMTLWLKNSLSSEITGRFYMYEKKNAVNVDDRINNISQSSYFLASYTQGGDGTDTSGKLRLAISDNGLDFYKLSNSYIFDANLGSGFEHDISIIEKDSYFYIIASSGAVENNNVVFTVFRSLNLRDWNEYTKIKIDTTIFTYDAGNSFVSAWAPEILYLKNKYYLSFGVCEKWDGSSNSIIKGYIGELSDDFTNCTNIRNLTINPDRAKFTFDTTIFYDEEEDVYYAYFNDGGIYKSDSLDGEWKGFATIPLTSFGYGYMEGATIIKDNGWFFVYGDGTRASDIKPNNLLCFKTKDFTQYELVDHQFDLNIRHPKIIKINVLQKALAEKVYLDLLN